MTLNWQLENRVLEPMRRGVITPETAQRDIAMLVEMTQSKYPGEIAAQIIQNSDLGEAAGFRGGLSPAAGRPAADPLSNFDSNAIPPWQPSGAGGDLGLSPWTSIQQNRLANGLVPYVEQGHANVSQYLRKQGDPLASSEAVLPDEELIPQ
jgi:hypothetical protein